MYAQTTGRNRIQESVEETARGTREMGRSHDLRLFQIGARSSGEEEVSKTKCNILVTHQRITVG